LQQVILYRLGTHKVPDARNQRVLETLARRDFVAIDTVTQELVVTARWLGLEE
ncbi:MAG: hypothetical protein L6R41_005683, partial [Letrouitia leprolyta]